MPLSEEELRLLEQMERALAEEDPKFVSTIQGTTMERSAKMRAIAAGVVFALGVAMLLGGAVAQQTWLGIVGFVVMLGSAIVGLTAWRGRHAPARPQHDLGDLDQEFSDHDPRFQERFRLVEGGKPGKPRGRQPRSRQPKSSGTFMQRMEQRWQQRRGRGGY